MGIPAIVTGWSGTADFVNSNVGYLINFTLSKVVILPMPLSTLLFSISIFAFQNTGIPHMAKLSDTSIIQVPESEPWWFKGAKWADADVLHLRKVRVGEEEVCMRFRLFNDTTLLQTSS